MIAFISSFLAAFFLWVNSLINPSNPVAKPEIPPVLSPSPTLTPTPTPPINWMNKSVYFDNVPFTVQAPLGEWKDPRQQDACEEASILMAYKWLHQEKLGTPQEVKEEIIAIAQYQLDAYGDSRDTSAKDTVERIAKGYYHSDNFSLKENATIDDIVTELHKGNLVITPMNGQALKNPYFTQPGPERHMVLIIGYDSKTQEFITNDTGIGRGKDYRYPIDVFYNAIRDYETGYHVPIVGEKKNMIIVSPSN